jgi:hypothetical protein
MIKRLLVMLPLALVLVLVGCTDPVKVEKANAIRRESEALYLATATHVAMEAKATDVAIAAAATAMADEEEVRAETQAERIAKQEKVIKWSTVSLAVLMLGLTVCLIVAAGGGAVAFVSYVNLQARLIWIDRTTRTFPIYLHKDLLADLEVGERARLDEPSQAHVGRLIGSVQARVTGLLAQSAEKIAKSTGDAQPGDMLPAIGQSVPLLDSDWLPELKERGEQ